MGAILVEPMSWLGGAMGRMQPYLDRLAVWRGYEAELTSLTILAVGIALYTILVFTFYQNLSRRSAFHTGWGRGRAWGRVVEGLESALVFPTMSFLYFSVLAASLFFLAKTQTTYQIFLLAMAVVASVRLLSYFTEIASGDLARLLPLSLLGVVLVDPSYATWGAVWARYQEVPGLLPVLGRFFLLFLVLESGLRIVAAIGARIRAAWRKPTTTVTLTPEGESLDTVSSGAPGLTH